MENEKAAVKRSIAQEARFRDEKQRIVESMGGSSHDLEAPCADTCNQRSKRATKPGAVPSSSSLLARNSTKGFQESCDCPEQPAPTDDLPPMAHVQPIQYSPEQDNSGSANALQYQVVVDSVAMPIRDEATYYNVTGERRTTRGPNFKKNTGFIVAAVILAVSVAGIAGGAVAFFNRADDSAPASSPSSSTTDEGTVTTNNTGENCKLDREALAQCENGGLVVPECAASVYQALLDTYADSLLAGAEEQCDVAHQGLVALAVSQTNHGKEVVDPTMFFAMSTLYFALKGTQWREDTNWLKGSSPCHDSWYGIECSPDGSLALVLTRNELQGFLPTEIGLLSNLRDLSIGWNTAVSGTLPSEVGLLEKLQAIDVRLTSMHSELPSEIGMLTMLTSLGVVSTLLSGPIPSEIGNLVQLGYLEFVHNSFTGTLPTQLGNLVQLQGLRLGDMPGITGTIPSQLVALTRLEVFELLYLNAIDYSPFPEVVTVATNLTSIDIRSVDVTGSVPTTIGHLSNLQQLTLDDLETTGTIPTEIGLLSNLDLLFFEMVNLQGTIPTEVGLLTKLSTLVLFGNSKISGTLPSELGSLTALGTLNVRDAELVGTIPPEVCALNLLSTIFIYNACEKDNTFLHEEEWCLSNTCNI